MNRRVASSLHVPDRGFGRIKAIRRHAFFIALLASIAFAQTNSDLPPRVRELVPPGTKIISQTFTGMPSIASAEFTAEKGVAMGRTIEYHLKIRAFDNSSPSWKMQESAYRLQMEERIKHSRTGLAPETVSQGLFTAEPVKEIKHPWGSGLTQRIRHHPPRASEYVTYSCAYFGMKGGIVFELHASGLPDTPQGGDQWAQKVAEAAAMLSVANIGN